MFWHHAQALIGGESLGGLKKTSGVPDQGISLSLCSQDGFDWSSESLEGDEVGGAWVKGNERLCACLGIKFLSGI